MITNRFETILADTAAARDLHHEIRYQVFCEETGFEDRARFPDGRERDAFDDRATHFIIWDRLERVWVAAMRLVPAIHPPLPCETICGQELAGLRFRRPRTVEFSRLCILARHRKTAAGTFMGPHGLEGEPDDGPHNPAIFQQEDHEIFLRLLRASVAWGREHGVDYCYFIVTRALSRLLQRFGIPLEVVGEALEHRGVRIPHAYQVQAAEAGMLDTIEGYRRMSRSSRPFVPYSEFIGQRPAPALAGVNVIPFPARLAAETHRRVAPAKWQLPAASSNAA